jgi:hypothetical protein
MVLTECVAIGLVDELALGRCWLAAPAVISGQRDFQSDRNPGESL